MQIRSFFLGVPFGPGYPFQAFFVPQKGFPLLSLTHAPIDIHRRDVAVE